MAFFLSFEGRISRGRFLAGAGVLVLALFVLNKMIAVTAGSGWLGGTLSLMLFLAALYPALALATRRLADRGKPPMPWLALFFAPGMVAAFLASYRIGYRPLEVYGFATTEPGAKLVSGLQGLTVPGPATAAVGLVALLALFWALVELGMKPGAGSAGR